MYPHGGSKLRAIWHGTSEETRRLNVAITRFCGCTTGRFGAVTTVCSVHQMLGDQRVLDHLLYVYRMRERFERAEWSDGLGEPRVTTSPERLNRIGSDGLAAGTAPSNGDQRAEPPLA